MGLASSQARLLSLTGRMHDIEYKAQKLEAQKLQMSNESDKVYQEYQNALNATKVQVKNINNDGSIEYVNATYNNLLEKGYQFKFFDDNKIYVDGAVATNFVNSNGSVDKFHALQIGRINAAGENDGWIEIYSAQNLVDFLNNPGTGKKIRLMADIDLSSSSYNTKNVTSVEFDGNGHTISGLTKSLFANIDGDSKVYNLNLSGNVSGTGMLANMISNGNIHDISLSGSVTGAGNVGGLAGLIHGSADGSKHPQISNINCNVNVTNTSTAPAGNGVNGDYSTGGLAGYTAYSDFKNITVSGNVTGSEYVGGFAGMGHSGTSIDNVIVNTNVTGLDGSDNTSGKCIGGMIGSWGGSSIKNSIASGTLNDYMHDGTQGSSGGFIGQKFGTNSSSIENCTANVDMNINKGTSTNHIGIGGFIGVSEGNITIKDSDSLGDIVLSHNPAPPTAQNPTYDFSGSSDVTIDNCYSSSNGSNGFAYTGTSGSGETATSNNNTTTVTPPTIQTTETLTQDSIYIKNKALFNEMKENGYITIAADESNLPAAGNKDNHEWLTNMINNGFLILMKVDTEQEELYNVNVATDTDLKEVSDEVDLKKAEAQYEADMRKINKKDAQIDTELSSLETERTAIKTQMEGLKTVTKDNIDKTFKLFS